MRFPRALQVGRPIIKGPQWERRGTWKKGRMKFVIVMTFSRLAVLAGWSWASCRGRRVRPGSQAFAQVECWAKV